MRIIRENLIEGAEKARGCTVVIDVFRAFTTASYVLANDADSIIPVGGLDRAFELKRENPEFVLMGEREGLKVQGFKYGNSPSKIKNIDFSGCTVVMTTSAGTQGLVNAKDADEIIAGSFVCISAVVDHIKEKEPDIVTLVAMGKAGTVPTDEDELCARYIERSLKGEEPDFSKIKDQLRDYRSAKKFFDSSQTDFPEGDFHCAMDKDRFHFYPEVIKGDHGLKMIRSTFQSV